MNMIASRYELDNGMGRGSFYAVLALYRRQAYIVIAIGLGFGLFSGWVHYDAAAILLFLSAILAWLFMTWLTICYEKYLHSKRIVSIDGGSSYTWFRYAITDFIAFFTIVTFVGGLIVMLFSLLEH